MKLLIDESLSARVAALLVSAGHVGDLNMLGAPDTDVMTAARQDRRCVVSVDTDFGELLAVGKHTEPSVVLLRRAPHRPQEQAALLINALPLLNDDLDIGAIVVLTPDRARVRGELPPDPLAAQTDDSRPVALLPAPPLRPRHAHTPSSRPDT